MSPFADGSVMPVISMLVFASVILLCEALYLLWRARRGAAALRLQRRLDLVARTGEGQSAVLKQHQLNDGSLIGRLLSGTSLAAMIASTALTRPRRLESSKLERTRKMAA